MPPPKFLGKPKPGDNEGVPITQVQPENAIVPGIAKDSTKWRVGVFGASEKNVGVWGRSTSGGRAGYFEGDVAVEGNVDVQKNMSVQGDVRVSGNISADGDIVLSNADCAEDFDATNDKDIVPGTVMVLGPDGKIQTSSQAYDRRVAGVISGAGKYRPGIVLDKQSESQGRYPVALVGKVYCKVDAQYGVIEPGDLLTTSPTTGHAMKASDTGRAFGAVLGKALGSWHEGQGLVPMLVVLQ